MYSDIYPTKYMRKATATFWELKFQLPQNLYCKCSKQHRVVEASFILYCEFYAENTQIFLWNTWNI